MRSAAVLSAGASAGGGTDTGFSGEAREPRFAGSRAALRGGSGIGFTCSAMLLRQDQHTRLVPRGFVCPCT